MGNKHFEKGGEPDELKTLKDMHGTDDIIDGKNAVYKENIKAEAMKIHKLADDHYKFNREMPFMASWDRERKFLQKFLEWWCNITGDDLNKNEK